MTSKSFCAMHGSRSELTAPYSPASNGVAKRYNRILCERVRCMLSTLPHAFWGEAMQTAVHICNRSPNQSLQNDIPEEVWSGKPASYDHLRVFGCEAFVHVRNELRSKLDAKSIKGIFNGYGDTREMGYKVWLPSLKKIIRSRDVVFNEGKLMMQNLPLDVDSKRVKFGPPHMAKSDFRDALPGAKNQNQRAIFEPKDAGQHRDAHDGDGQSVLMANPLNRA